MTEPLAADHPNLQKAAGRLQRISWVWAALLLGMGILTLLTTGRNHAGDPVPWFLAAGVVALLVQPASLALVAALFAFPLIILVPGVEAVFGPDPIRTLMTGGSLEFLGVILIRLGTAVTAWNQFLFYRLLYGTEGSRGIDPELPPIPEVVPNRTRELAVAGGVSAVAGIGASLAALAPSLAGLGSEFVRFGLWFSIAALGLGLGVIFSRTAHRSTGLAAAGLGLAGLLLALAVGRVVAL